MTAPETPTPEDIEKLRGTDPTVSELLAFFGFRYRNFESVPMIGAALANAGLTTEPSFITCGHNATVRIIDLDETAANSTKDAKETEEPDTLPTRPFLVSDIPSATAGLTSVTSAHTLTYALHLMQTENYSQIPVIDGKSSLKGVVTWKSVAIMCLKSEEPTLTNAMQNPHTVELHQDLFRELSDLCEYGYLLVRNSDGELNGIITTTDITNRFHETALPFFLVGKIELQLRSCLGARLTPDAIRAVQGRNKTGDISDLMFGDYLKLLRPNNQNASFDAAAAANWQALGWRSIDRTSFIDHLTRVKNIRNNIAHFDAKPPSVADIEDLQKFSTLLNILN
ncbi:CBS domain-containing protein [Nocardia sp. 004]|uniref:CBS domain-containing protein n=1 Tax=Nocardia sp. 004 TaxID=3385978 RepID=UPI0039A3F24E